MKYLACTYHDWGCSGQQASTWMLLAVAGGLALGLIIAKACGWLR